MRIPLFGSLRRLAYRGLFLSILAAVSACTTSVDLLTDVPESEVNEVLAALADAGIHAVKRPGKEGLASITVDQKVLGKSIATLNGEGLPRERFAKMGEVFRKEGLISSPLEERARYLWALSQELAATVSQIDGVLKARVHVVLPERSTGSDPAVPSSAAVFIKFRKQYNMDEASLQIKRLVANSISGLTTDKVTIVLLPATPYRGTNDHPRAFSEDSVFGYPVASESALSLKILFTGMLLFSFLSLGVSLFVLWSHRDKEWPHKFKWLKIGRFNARNNGLDA